MYKISIYISALLVLGFPAISFSDPGNSSSREGSRAASPMINDDQLPTDTILQLQELEGSLILLKAGTYLKGRDNIEPNPLEFGANGYQVEQPSIANIPNPFWMQRTVVSQYQFGKIMGNAFKDRILQWDLEKGYNAERFIGNDLPIILLNRAEEEEYISRLNEEVNRLRQQMGWLSVPPLRMPNEIEREYATTIPLGEPRQLSRHIYINANHTTFPGELLARRSYGDGPYEVDSKHLEEKKSNRGFLGLAQGVMEITKNYIQGGYFYSWYGCAWFHQKEWCGSSAHRVLSDETGEERFAEFGLRLVRDAQ